MSNACFGLSIAQLSAEAERYGIHTLPAYATSAVRKAKNPQALLDPLRARFGCTAKILSEDDEGRLNLLGLRARPQSRGPTRPPERSLRGRRRGREFTVGSTKPAPFRCAESDSCGPPRTVSPRGPDHPASVPTRRL